MRKIAAILFILAALVFGYTIDAGATLPFGNYITLLYLSFVLVALSFYLALKSSDNDTPDIYDHSDMD